jgi:hypothetical protein
VPAKPPPMITMVQVSLIVDFLVRRAAATGADRVHMADSSSSNVLSYVAVAFHM